MLKTFLSYDPKRGVCVAILDLGLKKLSSKSCRYLDFWVYVVPLGTYYQNPIDIFLSHLHPNTTVIELEILHIL